MQSFSIYYGYAYASGDLGAFVQILWYAGQWHIPLSSLSYPYDLTTPWLSFHFSPLIFIFAPLFRLAHFHIEILLVIHVLVVSLVVIPVYAVCRRFGYSRPGSCVWLVILLCNPFAHYNLTYSLQENTIAMPLFAFAYWTVVTGRKRWFLLTMLLLLLTKEHMGAAVAGFGLLWGWYHREWGFGWLTALIGIGFFIAVFTAIMPWFGASIHPMLLGKEAEGFSRYRWIYEPYPQILQVFWALITHPVNLGYLGALLGFFLVFPPIAAGIFLLPAGADFLANYLSELSIPKKPYVYHSANIIVCLVVASAAFLATWCWRKTALYIQGAICVVILISFLLYTGRYIQQNAPLFFRHDMEWAYQSEARQKASAYLNTLPQEMRVGVQGNVGYFLAKRSNIFPSTSVSPEQVMEMDVFVYRLSPYTVTRASHPVLVPLEQVHMLLNNLDYGVVLWEDPWIIIQKGKQDIVDKETIRKRVRQIFMHDVMLGIREDPRVLVDRQTTESPSAVIPTPSPSQ
ncbi:MAG: DUF2079 domain-containing protein [Hyphomicrobiales bacterium]|nr:DUF2079 domain-containing protein [Hyphomicrobiales bacterium]